MRDAPFKIMYTVEYVEFHSFRQLQYLGSSKRSPDFFYESLTSHMAGTPGDILANIQGISNSHWGTNHCFQCMTMVLYRKESTVAHIAVLWGFTPSWVNAWKGPSYREVTTESPKWLTCLWLVSMNLIQEKLLFQGRQQIGSVTCIQSFFI